MEDCRGDSFGILPYLQRALCSSSDLAFPSSAWRLFLSFEEFDLQCRSGRRQSEMRLSCCEWLSVRVGTNRGALRRQPEAQHMACCKMVMF
jgi:hypothetical protein